MSHCPVGTTWSRSELARLLVEQRMTPVTQSQNQSWVCPVLCHFQSLHILLLILVPPQFSCPQRRPLLPWCTSSSECWAPWWQRWTLLSPAPWRCASPQLGHLGWWWTCDHATVSWGLRIGKNQLGQGQVNTAGGPGDQCLILQSGQVFSQPCGREHCHGATQNCNLCDHPHHISIFLVTSSWFNSWASWGHHSSTQHRSWLRAGPSQSEWLHKCWRTQSTWWSFWSTVHAEPLLVAHLPLGAIDMTSTLCGFQRCSPNVRPLWWFCPKIWAQYRPVQGCPGRSSLCDDAAPLSAHVEWTCNSTLKSQDWCAIPGELKSGPGWLPLRVVRCSCAGPHPGLQRSAKQVHRYPGHQREIYIMAKNELNGVAPMLRTWSNERSGASLCRIQIWAVEVSYRLCNQGKKVRSDLCFLHVSSGCDHHINHASHIKEVSCRDFMQHYMRHYMTLAICFPPK